MGHKISIFVAFSVTLLVGLVATGTLAFADDEMKDGSNPFYMCTPLEAPESLMLKVS